MPRGKYIGVLATAEEHEKFDRIRRSRDPIPSIAQMIRDLIDEELERIQKREQRKAEKQQAIAERVKQGLT